MLPTIKETPGRTVRRAVRGRGRVVAWGGLAWLPVAAWGGWALVRLAGLERGYPLVALMAFTPYVAVLSVVPVGCALVARRWLAVVAALAVAAALGAAVLPRAIGGPSATAGGPVLRVLTANLLHGRADPAALVKRVRQERVDVLSLQEVPPAARAALDRAGLRTLLPNAVVEPGAHSFGPVLYARFPLRSLPDRQPTTRAQPYAALAVPGAAPVQVMAVHLSLPSRHHVGNWSRDLAALPRADPLGPVRILAGDFNATLDHAKLRALLTSGYVDAADATGAGLTATWPAQDGPSWVPGVVIDHVLVDARCSIGRTSVLEVPGSDHRAVLTELRLPAGHAAAERTPNQVP